MKKIEVERDLVGKNFPVKVPETSPPREGQKILVHDRVPAEDGQPRAVDGEVEPLAPQVVGLKLGHEGDRVPQHLVVGAEPDLLQQDKVVVAESDDLSQGLVAVAAVA